MWTLVLMINYYVTWICNNPNLAKKYFNLNFNRKINFKI